MRGLDNNEEAKNLVENFKGSTENRMRSLYNLGYWQGFDDGQREAVQMLERTLMDMTTADRKGEPQSVTYNPTSVNNIWEKPTNPYVPNEQIEPRKEQNFCGKCRYLYRDFKYGLSCYRLMDNEPCKYEERKDEPNSSEKPNNCEPKICDTCRYYNSNIPCGSTPSACKEADKFAEEFVDGLKKLKQTVPTISKMEQVDKDINVRSKDEPQTCEECEHWNDTEDGCADRHGCKDEPQTVQPCDGCEYSKPYIEYKCTHHSCKYEDEPQTEPSFTATDFGKGTITRYTDEPQTDCAWK